MPSAGPAHLRSLWRLAAGLRRDERGSTAIELSLLALPFLAVLFAVIEGALVFWANQVLGTAVAGASRELYTGRFQQATSSTPPQDLAGRFRDEVCRRTSRMFSCDTLKVDVRTYASFPDGIPNPIITDPDGTRRLDPNFGAYQAPQPTQIAVVQAAVEYPVLVPLMGANKSNISGNKRLLLGTAAFRTEAF
jgi:Flp pilus assembly protein TadG